MVTMKVRYESGLPDSDQKYGFAILGTSNSFSPTKLYAVVLITITMQQDTEKNHDMGKSSWAYPGHPKRKRAVLLIASWRQILNYRLQEITVKYILWLHKDVTT